MKFQSVFIMFNILLVIFLAIIIFIPALLIRELNVVSISQNLVFVPIILRSTWFLMVILVAVMAGFDVFYLRNRKLYALLEKEDWPALIIYLEDRIIGQGKYSPRLVRLLANTYLVLSDSTAVMSLENKVFMAKPSLVNENALIFGTARILGKDIAGAVRFFESRLESVNPGLRQWVRWYYGFSLLLNRQFEKAADEFSRLTAISNDGIIAGLSAYFLSDIIRKSMPGKSASIDKAVQTGRERILKILPAQKNWDQKTKKIQAEIYGVVLSQYMGEAGQWLYREKG